MRRILCLVTIVAALASLATPAQASSWIFRRSYYSHFPLHPVHIGPRSVDGPYYTRPQGAYVTGGLRRTNNWIQIPGAGFDNVQTFETWIQAGAKF